MIVTLLMLSWPLWVGLLVATLVERYDNSWVRRALNRILPNPHNGDWE